MGSLQQRVKCDGCGAGVAVPVESNWSYRLNSLIRNGIALHGCVPVICALRDLREKAKDSFIFTHGVALFRAYFDRKPAAEIDLLCISDGQLICGEVKSSAFEFKREDLGKLAQVARDIGADQVVISAFNDEGGFLEKQAETLKGLLPLSCTVVTSRPSPWAFGPKPHAH